MGFLVDEGGIKTLALSGGAFIVHLHFSTTSAFLIHLCLFNYLPEFQTLVSLKILIQLVSIVQNSHAIFIYKHNREYFLLFYIEYYSVL